MRLSFAAASVVSSLLLSDSKGDTIYSSSFESQSEVDSWNPSSNAFRTQDYVKDGSWAINTKGPASFERTIPTTGCTNVAISLWWTAKLLESPDFCFVHVRYSDGGSWNQVSSITDGDDDMSYNVLTFADDNANNNADFAVKLSGNGAHSNDQCFFDQLSVTGSCSGDPPATDPPAGGDPATDPPVGGGDPPAGGTGPTRSHLTYATLMGASDPSSPVDTSEFLEMGTYSAPSNTFEGELMITSSDTGLQKDTIYDKFNYATDGDRKLDEMPMFRAKMIQSTSGELIPEDRSNQAQSHPQWETMAGVGKCWDEDNDNGYTRCSFPLTLTQKNANCVHQGLMTFLFKDDGSQSKAYFQVGSETCKYYKTDLWGLLSIDYITGQVADSVASGWLDEVANRLAEAPLDDVDADLGMTASALRNDTLDPTHRSGVGFLSANGKHYVDTYPTRHGDYPFPRGFIMPSYSVAKTIWTSVALMALHKEFPSVDLPNRLLKEYIGQCTDKKWNDVTLQHALRMATGVYFSSSDMIDENAKTMTNDFFLKLTHAEKIDHCCNSYKDHTPDQTWVYHTSDHYMVVTALDKFVNDNTDFNSLDEYLDATIWTPLHLSQAARGPHETYDSVRNPFGGWGMFLTGDDLAKWTKFLAIDDGKIGSTQVLDETLYRAAMQETDPTPAQGYSGISTGRQYTNGTVVYENGVWGYPSTRCAGKYLPGSRGYGGISIVYFKGAAWWYVRDDGKFPDHEAVEKHVHDTGNTQC